jgi:pimeloyl-ACP methyl ester carboxylesterase
MDAHIPPDTTLPGLSPKIISRSVVVNDLDMHILECFPTTSPASNAPLVLLLHGFPELSYSWRKIIQPLADAGFHVVAPDQRGYGRTKPLQVASQPADPATTTTVQYDDDLAPYRMLNLTKDIVSLVYTLGHTSAAAVVGHDFGSPLAGFCALFRPDLFKSVVFMSHPFTGAPALPYHRHNESGGFINVVEVAQVLAALTPPRKEYTQYFSSAQANTDMCSPPSGIKSFLRGYYHAKSADSATHVTPRPLDYSEYTVLPNYYLMPLHDSMPQVIASDMPSPSAVADNTWLPDAELDVYTSEYARTGFQGWLNWYRCMRDPMYVNELQVLSGKKIDIPAMFIAGKMDWGVYKIPGGVENMMDVCTGMAKDDCILIDRAGHWVQQEKADAVLEHLLKFLRRQT